VLGEREAGGQQPQFQAAGFQQVRDVCPVRPDWAAAAPRPRDSYPHGRGANIHT
jgi:hypothetical protein